MNLLLTTINSKLQTRVCVRVCVRVCARARACAVCVVYELVSHVTNVVKDSL